MNTPPLAKNEYFQWQPEHNQNSAQHVVKPGEELFGSITYDATTHSYDVYHNSSDGWEVHMPIKIQKGADGQYKSACPRPPRFAPRTKLTPPPSFPRPPSQRNSSSFVCQTIASLTLSLKKMLHAQTTPLMR